MNFSLRRRSPANRFDVAVVATPGDSLPLDPTADTLPTEGRGP